MQTHGLKITAWRKALLSAVISGILGGPAYAQEKGQNAISELNALTVTAPPLNRAFQVNAGAFGAKDTMDVPLAIQSYGAEAIADTSARTLRDVLAIDPSVLTSNYGGGFDNFRLRGFAMDNFNTIRRDGMALAPHYDVPLELIERVDVLKGPSGFLYGFNSPGGTINYIPKRPTRDSFTSLTLQATSLEGRYISVDTSNSLANEAIGYRLNAGYEKIGDFDHFGDLERKFVGLATDFRFSDQALLQLNADWSWKSAMSDPLLRADQGGRKNSLDPSSYVLPPIFDRRDALSPSWYRHKTEAYNVEAKFEYTMSDAWASITQANGSQVKRHGGYVDLFDIRPNGDIGYSDLFQSRGEVFTTWSLQSYLSGKFTTGHISHDLFIGASYREFTDKSPYWDLIDSRDPGMSIGDISVGNIRHPTQPSSWDFGPEREIEFRSKIKESSVFASDLITFNNRFQLLLGGRHIAYRARNLSATAEPQERNVFVPTGALIYRPADSVMSYLSYSRGFEKGDYAPYNAKNANQPTATIESEQFEIGLKTDINQRLNIGVSLFEIRRDASYLNTDNYYVSNGRFRHRGLELNSTARLTPRLKIQGNLAYLDAELQEVTDITTLGKRSEGVPRWKATFGSSYDFSGIPGLSIDTQLSYVGARPVDAQNSGFIPNFSLWNAGVSYETNLGSVPTTFRLHANNLTNKYYYSGVYYSGGLEVGRGREVFLSARFKL